MPECLWLPPPSDIRLSSDDVHVWCATLDLPKAQVRDRQSVLSADESSRAARFRFPQLSQRFIAGRGMLRIILGRYLCVDPSKLRFGYTAYGKPFLADRLGQEPLNFNVSHTDGLALYAIARARAIGVDIETIRYDLDCDQIAARFFSPVENSALHALPAPLRPAAFFSCWTRKEAYIKAHGKGLSLALDQFSVSLDPDEPARLLHAGEGPGEVARWSLRELTPWPGFMAALAVEGHDWHLSCWEWLGG